MLRKKYMPYLALLTAVIAVALVGFRAQSAASNIPPDFDAFKRGFPKGQLPFALTANDLVRAFRGDKNKKPLFLDYSARAFLPHPKQAFYSRLPVRLTPVQLLETADRVVAIYGVVRGHSAPTTFYITVLDSKGKVISGDVFASIHANELTEARIDTDLMVTKNEQRIQWSSEDIASATPSFTHKRSYQQNFALPTGKNGEEAPKEIKITATKNTGRAK